MMNLQKEFLYLHIQDIDEENQLLAYCVILI